jgi:hypothetical protein
MFEETKTLTGRLALWADGCRGQSMMGLPRRLESDLSEAKARIEQLEAEAEKTRRLSLELYTATTGPALRRAG